MKQIFLCLFFALFSISGWGAEGQFFFQPTDRQHVVTPSLSTSIVRVAVPDATFPEFDDTSELKSISLAAEYEYGLLENLSLGILQSYSYSDFSGDGVTSDIERGLDDLFLYSKGFHRLNNLWTLRYGLGASLSLENSKPDNQYSGRNELTPYLGFDVLLNKAHRIGGRLTYSFLVGKQKVENTFGTVAEFTGGETVSVSALYEFNWKNGLVGAAPTYTTILGTKSNNSTSETLRFISNPIFANFYFGDSVTLIPALTTSVLLNNELNGVEIRSYVGLTATISARFKF